MTSSDPPPHLGDESHETLRRLEERLGRASEAAERLIAEAASEAGRRAARAAERIAPPPAGWQMPRGGEKGPGAGPVGELEEALGQAIRSLRELIPPELERRLLNAVREVLLAIRALIDWYLERLERRRSEPPEVQDIPIA